MPAEYLTAKEFAKRAGVSIQTIYKQMSQGRLADYVKEVNGQKMLPALLLDKFYSEENEIKLGSIIIDDDSTDNQSESTDKQPYTTINQPNNSTVEQPKSTVEQPNSTVEQPRYEPSQLEEVLNKTIAALTEQLAIKDKQIQDLNDRLAEASANLQKALDVTKGQQYIHAADKTKDLIEVQAETKEAQDKPQPTAADPKPIQPEQQHQTKTKKQSFWQRLFG